MNYVGIDGQPERGSAGGRFAGSSGQGVASGIKTDRKKCRSSKASENWFPSFPAAAPMAEAAIS
jgi:hypothetical protein